MPENGFSIERPKAAADDVAALTTVSEAMKSKLRPQITVTDALRAALIIAAETLRTGQPEAHPVY